MRTKTKVYLVEYDRWDESYIDSVWSSEPKAIKRIKKISGKVGPPYYITELTVDLSKRNVNV